MESPTKIIKRLQSELEKSKKRKVELVEAQDEAFSDFYGKDDVDDFDKPLDVPFKEQQQKEEVKTLLVLKDAAVYKKRMLSERVLKNNLSYIAKMVESAVERQDSSMSVNVPLKVINDPRTLEELLRLHFKPNPKLIEYVCFCGAPKNKCKAFTSGMPTETCTPPSCEISWMDAEDEE